MFFVLREVAGWALTLIGLYIVSTGLTMLQNYDPQPRMIEGATTTLTGIFILRFGILLIRVSTAARVVLTPRQAGEASE